MELWLSPTAFGNQTISRRDAFIAKRLRRLTALRPHLATGLPLSCAIVVLRKTICHRLSFEPAATSTVIKRYLSMFVNNSIPAQFTGIRSVLAAL
jgi:hypothetical protein